jgi:hypothetical protein
MDVEAQRISVATVLTIFSLSGMGMSSVKPRFTDDTSRATGSTVSEHAGRNNATRAIRVGAALSRRRSAFE